MQVIFSLPLSHMKNSVIVEQKLMSLQAFKIVLYKSRKPL